jgi:hypothetical protein
MPVSPSCLCPRTDYVCERCLGCYLHCKCEPVGALVSVNSRSAVLAASRIIREARAKRDAGSPTTV